MQYSVQFVSSRIGVSPVNMAETFAEIDWATQRATSLAQALVLAGYGQFLIVDDDGEVVHSVCFDLKFKTS